MLLVLGRDYGVKLVGLLANSLKNHESIGYYLIALTNRGWIVESYMGVGIVRNFLETMGDDNVKRIAVIAYTGRGNEPLYRLQPYKHIVFSRHGIRRYLTVILGAEDIDPTYYAQIVGLDPSSYDNAAILSAWIARQLSYGLTFKELVSQLEERRVDASVLLLTISHHSDHVEVGAYASNISKERRLYVIDSTDARGVITEDMARIAEDRGIRVKELKRVIEIKEKWG
ncbi:MAG: hypothetical protein ABWW69_06380 [Pyrodictiaceae archaeon]